MAKNKTTKENRRSKAKGILFDPKSLVFLLLIVGAGFGVYALREAVYSSDIFKVKEIKFNIDLDESLKEKIYGRSMFDLDQNKIYQEIKSAHPEYKEASVTKKFPSTLVILVAKRQPYVLLKADKFYPVDKNAVIIDDGKAEALPGLLVIEINDLNHSLKKGEKFSDARYLLACILIEEWRNSNLFSHLPIQSINATIPEALYVVVEGAEVILGNGDYQRKLKEFEDLLSGDLKGKLAGMEYIDLRYQKVYLGQKKQ